MTAPQYRAAGEIFYGIRVIPVPADHEHAPSPGTVNIRPPSHCYVLESEWPALRARLLDQYD